jgi:hypothetical protein
MTIGIILYTPEVQPGGVRYVKYKNHLFLVETVRKKYKAKRFLDENTLDIIGEFQ